jgi:L-ribulose-5-phosphate 3-epimerase
MARIGNMQGRLVPSYDGRIQCFPRNDWQAEFALARDAGFDCIEWLYDVHDAEANPLRKPGGIGEILAVSARTSVAVSAICAHCFVENPIVCQPGRIDPAATASLSWLIGKAGELGVPLVIPLEENRHLQDRASQEVLLAFLEKALPLAEAAGVELDVESTLPPADLANLLARLPHRLLKVNYDSGNGAGMGYAVRDEFASYGQRIGRIHIKDKLLAGPNVPLGTGVADFRQLAAAVRTIGYTGDYTLEVARCAVGEELDYARCNRRFIVDNILDAGAAHDEPV